MLDAVTVAPPVAHYNKFFCKNASKKNDLSLHDIFILPALFFPHPFLFFRLFSKMSANSKKPCCPITTTHMNQMLTVGLT